MKAMIPVVCLVLIFCGGCAAAGAAFDWFFGTSEQDEGTPSGGSPAGAVGSMLDYLLPGAGGLLASLGGLWLHIRGKAWKKAFVATAEVIERAGATLKPDLSIAHDAAGVQKIVQSVVKRL